MDRRTPDASGRLSAIGDELSIPDREAALEPTGVHPAKDDGAFWRRQSLMSMKTLVGGEGFETATPAV